MDGVPFDELSEGECDALMGRQEEGEQTAQTGNASIPIGRHLHIPAMASLTFLAMGIVFFGARHMPNNTKVTSEYFGVLVEDSSMNATVAEMIRKGDKFAKCEELELLKVKKVLHNNLGGHGPDKGEEGIFYEVGLFLRDKFGDKLSDIVGNIAIHATSPYISKGNNYNGIHGKFMSIAIRPGTNLSFSIGAYDQEKKAPITLPYFSITFFDIDEGPEHHGSEYIIAQGFEHYYIAKDSQVNVTHTKDGATMFHATQRGEGSDNPNESEALSPVMKSKGVTLSYFNRAAANFTIGAEEGHTIRGFNFVLRPSLLCAKTVVKGKWEDPLNTSLPGVELPLMDGKEPVAGMAVPNFEVVLPKLLNTSNVSNGSKPNLKNISFKAAENGSSAWHLGGLCALVIAAAALWSSHA